MHQHVSHCLRSVHALRRLTAVGLLTTLAGLAAACNSAMDNHTRGPVTTTLSAGARSRLERSRIFFAHQSVGDNIVDGLKSLEKRAETPPLNIVGLSDAAAVNRPAFIHARLGRNGDPKSKTDAFIAALDAGMGQSIDLAFQKYCFVDFEAQTDPNAVFAYYRQGVERVQKEFPALTLVHVTAPLMSVQSGPKAVVKKWLGRAPDYYPENAVREQFNELMRREYGPTGRLFDLAAIEASRPGLPPDPIWFQGRKLYALRPEYTTDGGHLNDAMQQRVASALLSFLGEIVTARAEHLSAANHAR